MCRGSIYHVSFEGNKYISDCTNVEIGGSFLVGKYEEHLSIALFFLFIFLSVVSITYSDSYLITSLLVNKAHCTFYKWVEKALGGFLILNMLTLYKKIKCYYNPGLALTFWQIHYLFFSSEIVATLSIWKWCAKYTIAKIEMLSQKGGLESYFQASHYWQLPNRGSYYSVFLKTPLCGQSSFFSLCSLSSISFPFR